ncbi:MAG: hypothetical protein ACI82H_001687, partial [Alphaproteobacteria bacterium]
MVATERLATFLDGLGVGKIEAKLADKLALHLFDALGALNAGRQVVDAAVIAGLTPEVGVPGALPA